MTQDDIIRMAREAGFGSLSELWSPALTRFASLAAGAEREACADLVLTLTCMGDAKECFEVAATYIHARRQQ